MINKPSVKAWVKPEMIILVRGKPEESVLTACKYNAAPLGVGADEALVHGCGDIVSTNCSPCQSRGGKDT